MHRKVKTKKTMLIHQVNHWRQFDGDLYMQYIMRRADMERFRDNDELDMAKANTIKKNEIMAKVITFSRTFPVTHIRKGAPTNFVEKFLLQKKVDYSHHHYLGELMRLNESQVATGKITQQDLLNFFNSLEPIPCWNKKGHTIRAGNRFVAGETFSPRVWSKVPYDSPQITFYDDTKVEKAFDFYFCETDNCLRINDVMYEVGYREMIENVSKNDGLIVSDFMAWFSKPIEGQIICWDENIVY